MGEFDKNQDLDQGQDKVQQEQGGGKPGAEQYGDKGMGEINADEEEAAIQEKLRQAGQQQEDFGGKGDDQGKPQQ